MLKPAFFVRNSFRFKTGLRFSAVTASFSYDISVWVKMGRLAKIFIGIGVINVPINN